MVIWRSADDGAGTVSSLGGPSRDKSLSAQDSNCIRPCTKKLRHISGHKNHVVPVVPVVLHALFGANVAATRAGSDTQICCTEESLLQAKAIIYNGCSDRRATTPKWTQCLHFDGPIQSRARGPRIPRPGRCHCYRCVLGSPSWTHRVELLMLDQTIINGCLPAC